MNSTKVFPLNKWYDFIEQGNSKVYGLDFLMEYVKNKYSMRLSYTLANATIKILAINNNKPFSATADIRHDVNLSGEYELRNDYKKRKWFTFNQAIHTGLPVTLPNSSISNSTPLFGEYKNDWDRGINYVFNNPNNYRLKPYHRLDLSYNSSKTKKHGKRIWSIGMINVYSRLNTYIIYQDGKQYKSLTFVSSDAIYIL